MLNLREGFQQLDHPFVGVQAAKEQEHDRIGVNPQTASGVPTIASTAVLLDVIAMGDDHQAFRDADPKMFCRSLLRILAVGDYGVRKAHKLSREKPFQSKLVALMILQVMNRPHDALAGALQRGEFSDKPRSAHHGSQSAGPEDVRVYPVEVEDVRLPLEPGGPEEIPAATALDHLDTGLGESRKEQRLVRVLRVHRQVRHANRGRLRLPGGRDRSEHGFSCGRVQALALPASVMASF